MKRHIPSVCLLAFSLIQPHALFAQEPIEQRLSPASLASAGQFLVQFSSRGGEAGRCFNGMRGGANTVLMARASGYEAAEFLVPLDGTTTLESVASTTVPDIEMVFATGISSIPTAPTGSTLSTGSVVFAVYRPDCSQEVHQEPVRVAAALSGTALLDRDVSPGAVGGAIVDSTGVALGLLVSARRAVTALGAVRASSSERRALAPLVPAQVGLDGVFEDLDPPADRAPSGGPPWKWIAGAAAVGAVAVALLVGGDSSAPSTGGLSVTIPAG